MAAHSRINESHECPGCEVLSANFATLFFGEHLAFLLFVFGVSASPAGHAIAMFSQVYAAATFRTELPRTRDLIFFHGIVFVYAHDQLSPPSLSFAGALRAIM